MIYNNSIQDKHTSLKTHAFILIINVKGIASNM